MRQLFILRLFFLRCILRYANHYEFTSSTGCDGTMGKYCIDWFHWSSKCKIKSILVFIPQAFDNNDKTDQKRIYVKRLFSGGDHSFAHVTSNNGESYDCRTLEYVSRLI